MLAKTPLSVDAAVQLALLNNPALQADFEELGITQADVVQAGLLENPELGASARFSNVDDTVPNIELNIVQNVLNLLTRPARKRIAETAFERTKLEISNRVLALVAEVQRSYYELLGAKQAAAMRGTVAEAAAASYELAQRFFHAGNISELDLAREEGANEQARADSMKADAAVVLAAEQLNRLMGLSGRGVKWDITDKLPALPASDPQVMALENTALSDRLDLAATRKETEAMIQALGLTRRWRYLGKATLGVDAEREADRQRLIGPNVTLELPIFDQQQARIARSEALLRQTQALVAALENSVRSEVRQAHEQMRARRMVAEHYASCLIPARERVVEQAQRYQNYMLIGQFELILAKRDEYDAYQQYLEAVRDYWIARAELRRASGGRALAGEPPTAPAEVPLPLAAAPSAETKDGKCASEMQTPSPPAQRGLERDTGEAEMPMDRPQPEQDSEPAAMPEISPEHHHQ
ncbi:MAG: TolC family protein [Chromatiales bacterium]